MRNEKIFMRYPATETAQKHIKILDEAARLFRERGFTDVSVSEIMKATGLTVGPFYNHFESKEALMAECLTHAGDKAVADLEQINKSTLKKSEFIDYYLSQTHKENAGTGCIIAALGSQIRNEPKAKQSFTKYVKSVLETLTERLPWSQTKTARHDSIVMLSTLVGAVVMARALDDDELSQEILNTVKSHFN